MEYGIREKISLSEFKNLRRKLKESLGKSIKVKRKSNKKATSDTKTLILHLNTLRLR